MYSRLTKEGRIVGSAIGKFIYWSLLILLAICGLAIARVKVDQFFASSPQTPAPAPKEMATTPPPVMAVAPQPIAVRTDLAPGPRYIPPERVLQTESPAPEPVYVPPSGSTVVEHHEFRWPWQKKNEQQHEQEKPHAREEVPKQPTTAPHSDAKHTPKPSPPAKSKPVSDPKKSHQPPPSAKSHPIKGAPPKKVDPPKQSGGHKKK